MHRFNIEKMKREMPYGKYIFEEGTQIIFNRFYEPIVTIKEADANQFHPQSRHNERIAKAKKEWFYNDGNPPWQNQGALEKCEKILQAFGGQV